MLFQIQHCVEQLAYVHAGVGTTLRLDLDHLAAGGPPRHDEAELAPIADHVIGTTPVGVARVVDRSRRILPWPAQQRTHAQATVPPYAALEAFADRLAAFAPEAIRLLENFLRNDVVRTRRRPPAAL